MDKHELIGRIVRIAQDEVSVITACDKIDALIKSEGFELTENQGQTLPIDSVAGQSEQLCVTCGLAITPMPDMMCEPCYKCKTNK